MLQAVIVLPAPVGALTPLRVTRTGVLFVIVVVLAVRVNLVPDAAGVDAGPPAGANDGACVVRLGAAAAVATSMLINSHLQAILAAALLRGI